MAQIRQTRYVCDACGAEVERKRDLVRFYVRRSNDWQNDASFDLCEKCEGAFLADLTKFVEGESEAISALARK